MSKCANRRVRWTDAEKTAVETYYKRRGRKTRRVRWSKLLRALPGRTPDAIKSFALAKRLQSRAPAWTLRENETLTRLWGENGERALLDALPGRTWLAITKHADRIGLPMGMPQGYVTAREAARRLGCDAGTVLRLGERAKVTIVRQVTAQPNRRRTKTGRRTPHLMVEWDRIREAYEAELARETITFAARRVGVPVPTLRRWVYEADVLEPCEEGRTRRDIRLDPAVVDSIVERRRGPAEAARRAA